MQLLLILFGLIAIEAGVIKEDPCNGTININDTYYDTETLKAGLDRPYLLIVDHATNILYFSYTIKDDNNNEFKTARLNLNTKEFAKIEGINNGFAQAVDQDTHEIYIGGSDGIYKYDYGNNKAALVAANGTDIWTLHYDDVLYFSIFPTQYLYIIQDGEIRRFSDLEDTKVDHFTIGKNDTIFFTNATGLYSQPRGKKNATLYEEAVHYKGLLRTLATDKNGNVYACLQDGVYFVNTESLSLEKKIDIIDAFGLAFDNDNNVIYSDATRLVRLKKSKKCK